MAVLLNRTYAGLLAGTVVQLSAELEAALIAAGYAVTSAAAPTSGAITALIGNDIVLAGTGAVAIGATTLVVSNPRITAQSKAFAVIGQAAADATFTSILRVSCAAGVMTVTGTGAATAAVVINYVIFP